MPTETTLQSAITTTTLILLSLLSVTHMQTIRNHPCLELADANCFPIMSATFTVTTLTKTITIDDKDPPGKCDLLSTLDSRIGDWICFVAGKPVQCSQCITHMAYQAIQRRYLKETSKQTPFTYAHHYTILCNHFGYDSMMIIAFSGTFACLTMAYMLFDQKKIAPAIIIITTGLPCVLILLILFTTCQELDDHEVL